MCGSTHLSYKTIRQEEYFCETHISYFKTISLFFFFFLFPFVDNISSVWRTSLIQSLQCKVAFQPALYFLLLREREVWWDQFSKLLSLKTLTEIKKNYNSPHLKNKKQKLRLSEEEEKLAHKTNQWERDYGVSTMIKRMELLG